MFGLRSGVGVGVPGDRNQAPLPLGMCLRLVPKDVVILQVPKEGTKAPVFVRKEKLFFYSTWTGWRERVNGKGVKKERLYVRACRRRYPLVIEIFSRDAVINIVSYLRTGAKCFVPKQN